MSMHMCYGVLDNCKNLLESYGEICVLCNKCGRFDKNLKNKEELKKESENNES